MPHTQACQGRADLPGRTCRGRRNEQPLESIILGVVGTGSRREMPGNAENRRLVGVGNHHQLVGGVGWTWGKGERGAVCVCGGGGGGHR